MKQHVASKNPDLRPASVFVLLPLIAALGVERTLPFLVLAARRVDVGLKLDDLFDNLVVQEHFATGLLRVVGVTATKHPRIDALRMHSLAATSLAS